MSMPNQVHYTVRYWDREWFRVYRGIVKDRALATKAYYESQGFVVQASVVAPNGRFMAKL